MRNPVLVHGIKSRMRGVRAPILMSVYFCILLAIFSIVYMSASSSYYYTHARPNPQGMELMIILYAVLVSMIHAVVVLMVPAMNAGNIAAEREKQTLDLLLSSRLSAIHIILGKIFSNLAFMAFLLVLTLPLFSVIYLLGSVMISDILKTLFFMLVNIYACASIATFYSALVKKSSVATILSYVTLLLFVVVTIAVGAWLMTRHYAMTNYRYDDNYIPLCLRINPIFATVELLAGAESNSGAGMDFADFLPGEVGFSFLFDSITFMIIASVLMNIASAIFIKPVQKLQMKSRPAKKQQVQP